MSSLEVNGTSLNLLGPLFRYLCHVTSALVILVPTNAYCHVNVVFWVVAFFAVWFILVIRLFMLFKCLLSSLDKLYFSFTLDDQRLALLMLMPFGWSFAV